MFFKEEVKAIGLKVVLLIIMTFTFSGCVISSNFPSSSSRRERPDFIEEIKLSETEYIELSLYLDIFKGENLKRNFIIACKEVGLDISELRDLTKEPDWAEGERYSFIYKSNFFKVYINSDRTISSINISGVKVYDQGYESYSVDDYLVDSGIVSTLQVETENNVRKYLKIPSSAKFSFYGWGVGRVKDLYTLSSSVRAKNAFGVESKIPFVAQYKVNQNDILLVSLSLGNDEVFICNNK